MAVSQREFSWRCHRGNFHDGFTGRVLTTVSLGGYSREGTHDGFTGRVVTTVSLGGYSRRFHGESCDDGFKRLLGTVFTERVP